MEERVEVVKGTLMEEKLLFTKESFESRLSRENSNCSDAETLEIEEERMERSLEVKSRKTEERDESVTETPSNSKTPE